MNLAGFALRGRVVLAAHSEIQVRGYAFRGAQGLTGVEDVGCSLLLGHLCLHLGGSLQLLLLLLLCSHFGEQLLLLLLDESELLPLFGLQSPPSQFLLLQEHILLLDEEA